MADGLAQRLPATVVPLDDFFAIDIPDHGWDAFSVTERLQRVFDWERVRQQALLPLLAGKAASWRPIDFETGIAPDGTYRLRSHRERREPAPIVILDGAYSAGPSLSDIIQLTVLIEVPIAERHARLAAREPPEFLARWHALWDEVEAYYFEHVRPPERFDCVIHLRGSSMAAQDQVD